MSIERSGTTHIQKPAGGSDSAHAKGRARAADDAAVSPAGGFLSLLSSFEVDAGVVAAGGDQEAGAVLPGLGGEKQQLAEAAPADPAVLLAGLLPTDAAMRLPADPALQLPADPALLLAQSLQSAGKDAIAQPGAAAIAEAEHPNGAARGVSAGSRLATAVAAEALATRAGAAAVLLPEQPESARQSPGEIFKKAMKTFADNIANAKPGNSPSGVSGATPDWRELKPTYITDVSSRNFSLPEALVATGSGDAAGIKPSERVFGRTASRQMGGSADGSWGPQALVAGGRIDTPAAMTDATMLPPEVQVAEQVKYWISSNVQNAELTLDGLGPDPVEVSISLQGNEAHVAFRSDQAETRLVLENAVSHLKGLLESEGLLLSGVSVGASGHDGTGSQEERRGRSGGRQAMVAVEPVSADGLSRVGPASGRAVDLFV